MLLFCVALRCVLLCCVGVVFVCVVLYCVMLCCVVWCCVVLCCAALCCAVLCCAVLCCAVLCCACRAVSLFHSREKLNNIFLVNLLSLAVPLGSIPELPAESCKEIKASEGQAVSGKYWFSTIKPDIPVLAYCDMETEGDVHNSYFYLLFFNVVINCGLLFFYFCFCLLRR